ncbi:MAG: glycosyltransferase family 39 protein [Anaerolineae bacterium]
MGPTTGGRKKAGDLWLAGLAVVVTAGAAVRLVSLDSAPPALHFDEAVYGLMARQIGPGYWPVFFPAYTGREPLYMYIMAGLFRLLGSTDVTLRLTSALIGILTTPLLYVLGRELYGRRVGLLAAAIMAGNYWHLSLSRNGYPNVLIPPLECLAVIFIWRGYRDRRPLVMGAGGLFVGLVLYTYLAARLFPVTLALYFAYVLVVDGRRLLSRAGGLALAVVAALLVFAPLAWYFYQHPGDFYERASQVLVFESGGGWLGWLRIMGTNLVRNLGGLFIAGDPRPLFNLPGKPVFTPLMALFFVLGLAVALRHTRRPEYGLLPVWVLGMCLPAILTDDIMPQSQRMSGIIPAVFLLAALGLETAWRWLLARARPPKLLASLVIVLLVAEGACAAYTYFQVWAREPMNYYAFHAPYRLAAEDAAPHLAAGDTVVVIAEHYRHPTAVFEDPAMRDALWLVQNKTLVVPARPQGEVVVYWPHHPLIPQPYIEARLPEFLEPVRQVLDPSGGVALDIYRLRDEAVRSARDAMPVASVGEIEILDWSVPADAPRDAPLPVELIWRVREATTAGRVFSVHLVDRQGHLWSQHTDLGFMPEQWQPGDTVYQLFEVPVPQGIPAGTYRVLFVLADAHAVPFPVSAQGESAGFELDLGQVRLTSDGATILPVQEGVVLGDALRLVAHTRFEDMPVQAPTLAFDITWQAARDLDADYTIELRFTDRAGGEAFRQEIPVAGEHGTSSWASGEIVHAHYVLELPDLAAGRYAVSLAVPGVEGTVDLGSIVAEANLRSYVVPPMEHTVGARFGTAVELLGYDLAAGDPGPGDSLALTLYWRAVSSIGADAKVFVHLVDSVGTIRAQVDAVPVQWQRPTGGWRPGEVLADPYILEIPADVPEGRYALYAGFYDAVTLDRWPVVTGDGHTAADERLLLTELAVGR